MRIAVIGGTVNILRRAHDLEVEVILFHQAGKFDSSAPGLCARIVEVDFVNRPDQAEEAVVEHHRQHPFDRVMSLTETGLVLATRLNDRLGLGGNSERTAQLLKDKARMRQTLDALGISPVRHRIVISAGEIAKFRTEIGGPVFVKPVDSSASLAVTPVGSDDDAEIAWERIRAAGFTHALAEEYLSGPEFSVDAFSYAGRHVVITVTRKLLAGNHLEIGHSMPAAIDDRLRAEAENVVRRMLDAVGLVEGPTHTEIRLTPQGPRIIESHNRIGGSRLFEMMGLAYGIDIVRMAVAIPLGLEPPLHESPPPIAGAAVRYMVPPAGRVAMVRQSVDWSTDSRVRLELSVAEGDLVTEQQTSLDRDAFATYVVASGIDEADAIRRCETVLDSITVAVEPVA